MDRNLNEGDDLFMRSLTRLTALLFALTLTIPALAQDDLDSVKVDPAPQSGV